MESKEALQNIRDYHDETVIDNYIEYKLYIESTEDIYYC